MSAVLLEEVWIKVVVCCLYHQAFLLFGNRFLHDVEKAAIGTTAKNFIIKLMKGAMIMC